MEEAGDLITCQIIFYPLGTTDIVDPVNEVIEVIESSSVEEIKIGATATTLKGDREDIYDLLNKISAEMAEENIKYAMSLNISNHCGCQ